jgi:hypothetical protein
VSFVRNARTCHAVVTRDPINMAIIAATVRNRSVQSEFKELHSPVNISFDMGLTFQITSMILRGGGCWGQLIYIAGFQCNRLAFFIPETGTSSVDGRN